MGPHRDAARPCVVGYAQDTCMEHLVGPSSRLGSGRVTSCDDVTNSHWATATGAGRDAEHTEASGECCDALTMSTIQDRARLAKCIRLPLPSGHDLSCPDNIIPTGHWFVNFPYQNFVLRKFHCIVLFFIIISTPSNSMLPSIEYNLLASYLSPLGLYTILPPLKIEARSVSTWPTASELFKIMFHYCFLAISLSQHNFSHQWLAPMLIFIGAYIPQPTAPCKK